MIIFILKRCLWGVPGSHKEQTTYFLKQKLGEDGFYQTNYNTKEPIYNIEKGIPINAEKGSVVLLHGDFVHYRYLFNKFKLSDY